MIVLDETPAICAASTTETATRVDCAVREFSRVFSMDPEHSNNGQNPTDSKSGRFVVLWAPRTDDKGQAGITIYGADTPVADKGEVVGHLTYSNDVELRPPDGRLFIEPGWELVVARFVGKSEGKILSILREMAQHAAGDFGGNPLEEAGFLSEKYLDAQPRPAGRRPGYNDGLLATQRRAEQKILAAKGVSKMSDAAMNLALQGLADTTWVNTEASQLIRQRRQIEDRGLRLDDIDALRLEDQLTDDERRERDSMHAARIRVLIEATEDGL